MTEDKELDEYLYEQCLIDTALKLKQRGFKNYQETATNICRVRVDEGKFDERSFASSGSKEEIKRTFALQIGDIDNLKNYATKVTPIIKTMVENQLLEVANI